MAERLADGAGWAQANGEGRRDDAHPPCSIANINARLANVVKQVTDTFSRLYDAAPFEKVSKAAMLAELLPAEVRSASVAAPVKMEAARTFRQVL